MQNKTELNENLKIKNDNNKLLHLATSQENLEEVCYLLEDPWVSSYMDRLNLNYL